MIDLNIKKIVEELIDTFLYAGQISIDLRNKGLTKKIEIDLMAEINQILLSLRIIKRQILNRENLKIYLMINNIEMLENQNLKTPKHLNQKK